jgi:uncharacterized protein
MKFVINTTFHNCFSLVRYVPKNFKPESDVDLMVEIDQMNPVEQSEILINLWNKFEDIFGRKVNLITADQQIRNPILKPNIDKTKQLFYDRTNRKIFI